MSYRGHAASDSHITVGLRTRFAFSEDSRTFPPASHQRAVPFARTAHASDRQRRRGPGAGSWRAQLDADGHTVHEADDITAAVAKLSTHAVDVMVLIDV